jgi:6-phosphogluconate dehydrogenase
VGSSGAGHYVKMVHNGIEYGLMQAYAEGLHILKEGSFKEQLNLVHITALWNTNSVIRSFLLSLAHDGLQSDQNLTDVSGKVSESGMGSWTDQEAKNHGIDDPVLEVALRVRAQSRENGGNYGTKILAMLRNKFGGHTYLDEGK